MKAFEFPEPKNHKAFPVAAPGIPMIGAAAFATLIFALLDWTWLAALGLLATFFIAWFFRDPDRAVPVVEKGFVSPADGRVLFVKKVDDPVYYNGSCLKISIFMSVFNVHVNRTPVSGAVTDVTYWPGKFFSANLDKASSDNERNAVYMTASTGERICFVQVAGLVARRIICRVTKGDTLDRGMRFGMICFGSRLDVYVPEESIVSVKKGDRVKAGETLLGYFK